MWTCFRLEASSLKTMLVSRTCEHSVYKTRCIYCSDLWTQRVQCTPDLSVAFNLDPMDPTLWWFQTPGTSVLSLPSKLHDSTYHPCTVKYVRVCVCVCVCVCALERVNWVYIHTYVKYRFNVSFHFCRLLFRYQIMLAKTVTVRIFNIATPLLTSLSNHYQCFTFNRVHISKI